MKFASLTIIAEETRYLKPVLSGLTEIDCCLVWKNPKVWSEYLVDREQLGKLEAESRNDGLKALGNFDYVFIVDSDEVYLKEDIEKMKNFIRETQKEIYLSEGFETLWKTPEYKIDPPEGHTPVVCVKPTVKFNDVRNVGLAEKTAYIPKNIATCYHFSYVKSDEEILQKVKNHTHTKPFIKNWYEDVWLKWTPEMENLNPLNPIIFKRAVKFNLPDEIKCRLQS